MKREALIVAMTHGETIFQQIKRQYPTLKGYLVYSSPFGQCEVTKDIEKILSEFPNMIHDSKGKTEAVSLINKKGKTGPKLTKEDLDIKEETFIEIRFKDTMFDVIFALQKDPLVSQQYTPQRRASIRIVLGNIGDLYQAGASALKEN
jgi:hypothetical protein